MKLPRSSPICIGMHQIELPGNAKASITSTYAGLRDRNAGSAQWSEVVSSLRSRAEHLKSSDSPRSARADALYRAAGAKPETAFANSRLVGFDVDGQRAVIAEHLDASAVFRIESHRVIDGRHFILEGKSSQASRYPAVRDGVLDTTTRYSPGTNAKQAPSDAFCASAGWFRLKNRQDVAGDAQLVVTFPDMPGVTFSLNLHGLAEPSREPPFAQRAARDLADLSGAGGVVEPLQQGKREYGSQSGDLVAIAARSGDRADAKAYKYFWHAKGKVKDPYSPEIEAELTSDGRTPLEAAAIENLWNGLMASFQLRK